MIRLELAKRRAAPYTILCLGSHCDDIEIGCGGTILKLLQKHDDAEVHWVAFSSDPVREREARASADLFLAAAGTKSVLVKTFRNGFFPYVGREIKEFFEELKQTVSPDLILTHYRHDLHQDHRIVSELTSNTFRDHLIFEYEIPKFDGDLGAPNVFIDLEESLAQQKTSYIMQSFGSQAGKHWFEKDTFLALMRLRGMESCSRYAEAFYSRKILLG